MKKQGSKGITLIALVITIIVMLILVAVTINVATNGGLISKAKEANEKTKFELEKESKLNDEMADKIDEIVSGKAKYKDEISGLPEGERSVAQEELSGDLKEAADDRKIVAVIEEGEDLAPIPQGFTISEVAEEQRISTGLVVKDNAGNEFVWVPVQDINDMAVKSGDNWRGKLYDFDNGGKLYDFSDESDEPREPYILEESNDEANGITQELMQSTFNTMVESVAKYGGFYVGRYETTNFNSSKITVKSGMPVGTEGQTWYAMYEKCKSLTTTYIQSEMIWGCEYDAMINWMLTGSQASKVNEDTNGNHVSKSASGSTSTDVINNIYDLEGNVYEFTQEVSENGIRSCRGGGCYGDAKALPTKRHNCISDFSIDYIRARTTLYIK